MSRMTRTVMSGSECSSVGAPPAEAFLPILDSALPLIVSQVFVRRWTSFVSSSSEAPSAAVRTMTPEVSGTTCLRMPLRRERSVSGSLREMPVIEPSGT